MARHDNGKASRPRPIFKQLRDHFDGDPSTLPVVQQVYATYERANLQLALDEYLSKGKRSCRTVGILKLASDDESLMPRLTRRETADSTAEGPVEFVDVPLPDDRRLACVKNGLFLVHDERTPIAILLSSFPPYYPDPLRVEVMAPTRELAEASSREIDKLTRRCQAFRGHIVSLKSSCRGEQSIVYHKLPDIRREDLILPEPLLERIERQTISFARHAERLKRAGRHLKRGLLLHGLPGTGKTLTAMYILSQMPQRTTLLLTGSAVGEIESVGALARMLTPATIILEDVDLIGTERGAQSVGANALLFELLNQMDGLAEDSDVMYILTTNRPDALEPALAARPGRIDQAIEIPLPDADCRRRLLELYARGMHVAIDNWNGLIEKTAGVSGAFLKELLRRAAVLAAEDQDGNELVVQDNHLEEALVELLVAGGPLTKVLLGATKNTATAR